MKLDKTQNCSKLSLMDKEKNKTLPMHELSLQKRQINNSKSLKLPSEKLFKSRRNSRISNQNKLENKFGNSFASLEYKKEESIYEDDEINNPNLISKSLLSSNCELEDKLKLIMGTKARELWRISKTEPGLKYFLVPFSLQRVWKSCFKQDKLLFKTFTDYFDFEQFFISKNLSYCLFESEEDKIKDLKKS